MNKVVKNPGYFLGVMATISAGYLLFSGAWYFGIAMMTFGFLYYMRILKPKPQKVWELSVVICLWLTTLLVVGVRSQKGADLRKAETKVEH